jgi:SAM-dependent methyltransferase
VGERLTEPQVEAGHYLTPVYDNPNRFASYWHQLDETMQLGGRVVEVGIGNGTVTAVLRARGLDVTTVDFDRALGPDVVADIRELPFPDRGFDTALSSQVLEHLPWETVPGALAELARVAGRGIVVSVPNTDVSFAFEARLPNCFQLLRLVFRGRLPVRHAAWGALQRASWRRDGGLVHGFAEITRRNQESLYCGNHFWELGAHGVRPEDFVTIAESVGLRLLREYRVARFPIHHFFVFAHTAAD